MFVIIFLRWLCGYVRVQVSSGSAGKLLTLCARNGIVLWKGRQDGDAYTGCVSEKYFKNLRALAAQAAIDVQLLETRGLPHLIGKYRRRLGLFGGVAIFLAILVTSQQFVWKVEVEGCRETDPRQLAGLLAEAGIHVGTLKKNIDLRDKAREILLKSDDLSWTALNLHGTTAILRVRERTRPPQKIDTDVPANVVAAEDGQIKRLQVTDGKAVLKEGETVRKGEVIVSGVWQDRWGLTHFVRAGAKAYAHVPRTLTVKIPLEQEARVLTQVQRRAYLELFGLRLPLFFYREAQGAYKLEQYSETPSLLGVSMPFSIGRESLLFYDTQRETITQEQALAMAGRGLEIQERASFGQCPVISRNVTAAVENGVLILRGDYEIEMDIAERKDISLTEYREREGTKKVPHEAGY